MGSHVFRLRGPSLIYLGDLPRPAPAGSRDYATVSDQIRRTLVHEMVGHRLAFCTAAGPLLTRDDLHNILRVAGVRFLKLIDSPSIEVDAFLARQDLLEAVRQIQYVDARTHEQRDYSNLTELIAFAAEGRSADVGLPYPDIHKILKRHLLCLPAPLNAPGPGQATLYEGYDVAQLPRRTTTSNTQRGTGSTPARRAGGRWLTLAGLGRACLARAGELVPGSDQQWIEAGSLFRLRVPFGGYLLAVEGNVLLASCFGLFGDLGRSVPTPYGRACQIGRASMSGLAPHDSVWSTYTIHNQSGVRIPFHLLELDASTLSRS